MLRSLLEKIAVEKFVDCFEAIKAFLAEKGPNYPELDNENRVVKLIFLTDIMRHLKKLKTDCFEHVWHACVIVA